MARSPVLGGGLTLFGGSGANFDIFNQLNNNNESARLALTKIEIQWRNGQVNNADYLAALQVYAGAQTPGSTAALNAQQDYDNTKYTLDRNALVSKVQQKQSTWDDLLSFDQSHLSGLDHNSDVYRSRLNQYQNTQQSAFADSEKAITDAYSAGQLTAAQALAWYQDHQSTYADNPDLADAIAGRVTDFTARTQSEIDQQTVRDYQDGKIAPAAFLSFAKTRQQAYAPGTADAKQWAKNYEDAKGQIIETGLLYRYGLSAKYAQLEQFVKSSAGSAPTGHSSSGRKTTRTVMDANGHWHTVTTRGPGSYTGPSPAAQQAYAAHQAQVADAKKEMAKLAKQLNGQPGGFVSNEDMLHYYAHLQADTTKGTPAWYAYQDKIDGFRDRIHADAVLAKSGIKITFPPIHSETHGNEFTPDVPLPKAKTGGSTTAPAKVAAAPAATGSAGGGVGAVANAPASHVTGGAPPRDSGGDLTLDQFMAAVAHQESGGRYDARNSSTGAFGKYQIMPANWPTWAERAGLPRNAPMTPDNQEKVARHQMSATFAKYHDWNVVAAVWFGGAVGTNPANWSPAVTKYVHGIMGQLGKTPTAVKSSIPTLAPSVGLSKKTGIVSPGLSVIKGEYKAGPHNATEQQLKTAETNFPSNMDSAWYVKFYSGIMAAVKAGATNFAMTLPNGRVVNYHIPTDSIDLHSLVTELDDRMIELRKTQLNANQGTFRENASAATLNTAVKRAGQNQIMLLDVASEDSNTPGHVANPLAKGLKILDQTKAHIQDYIGKANEAYKNGDYDMAYSYLKLATDAADENGTYVTLLAGYENQTAGTIAGIQKSTGATVTDKGMQAAIDRLANFTTELQDALAPGDKLMGSPGAGAANQPGTLADIIAVDAQGNVVRDGTGAIVYKPGTVRHVDDNGKVTVERIPPSGYDNSTGVATQAYVPGKNEQLVHIQRANGSFMDAYAKVKVGTIGYIVGPDGKSNPVVGKLVTMTINGVQTMVAENPFAPGKWIPITDKPLYFKAPKGFAVVPATDKLGNTLLDDQGQPKTAYQFSAAGDPSTTYKMVMGADGTWTAEQFTKGNGYTTQDQLSTLSFTDSRLQIELGAAGGGLDGSQLSVEQAKYLSMDLPGPYMGSTADQTAAYLKAYKGGSTTTDRPEHFTMLGGPKVRPRPPSPLAVAPSTLANPNRQRSIDRLDTSTPDWQAELKGAPAEAVGSALGLLPALKPLPTNPMFASSDVQIGKGGPVNRMPGLLPKKPASKGPGASPGGSAASRGGYTSIAPAKPKPKPKPKPRPIAPVVDPRRGDRVAL